MKSSPLSEKIRISGFGFAALLLIAMACGSKTNHLEFDQAAEQAAIEKMLRQQESDWNAGSIDGFMEGYWKSDSLVFISSTETNGWDAALARYKKSYPDKATMGALTFTFYRFNFLSPDACVVTGKYQLEREADEPSGMFTLIIRKIDGQWLVVYDHTS